MEELVGKLIEAVFVSNGEELLAFIVEDGSTVVYEARGDCCSESWFVNITGIDSLLNQVVLKVKEVDLLYSNYNVDDGRGRQESDAVYSYRLTTMKGDTDIIFRNSSNGYYGKYVTLYTGQLLEAKWTKIINDWRA